MSPEAQSAVQDAHLMHSEDGGCRLTARWLGN